MNTKKLRLFKWQVLTTLLMVVGYSGYYLCRSNFSVMLPQLIDELSSRGMDPVRAKIHLGMIASFGVLAYGIGKFLSAGLFDFIGGKVGFLSGMVGAIVFTLVFASGGGVPVFTFAWIGNRVFQSMGWVGMVKVTSRWFAFSSYGRVMGVISLSYLFGDAISRQLMSHLIAHGLSWRTVFVVDAAILFVLFVLNFILLKESPVKIGEKEPVSSSTHLFVHLGDQMTPPNLKTLLTPLFKSRVFWMVCLLSLGSTLVRETFNTWTPIYFTELIGLTQIEAASKSAWFPFFGGVSVLIAGFLSDLLGGGGRASLLFFGLLLSGFALFMLGNIEASDPKYWSVFMVSLIAFLLVGPYSYLGGAIALDFGGKQGSGAVCGIIDGVGYLGGYLSGSGIAKISAMYGWKGAFNLLGCIAWLSSLAAGFLFIEQKRSFRIAKNSSIEPNQIGDIAT